MKLHIFRRALVVALSVTLLGSTACAAAATTTPKPAPKAVVAETYADYSLMTSQTAGQYWTIGAGAVEAGQWTWAPQTSGQDWVSWGDAATWPPSYHEVLIHTGNWVMLDGWAGNGTYYTERVTSEWQAAGDCVTGKTPIPSDGGLQHYTLWTVPDAPYCLFATGVITEQSTGKTVEFAHEQVWSKVASEPNSYIGARPALKQHEDWWDDNQHPFSETLSRDQYIGKGVGMAFHIQSYTPGTATPIWAADLRYAWTW